VRPVPVNEACTEWADACGRDGGVAAVRYVFDSSKGRYRMADAGPVGGASVGAYEGSLVRAGSQWLIAARPKAAGVAWMKSDNPFASLPPAGVRDSFIGTIQKAAFLCADGQVRLFSGKGDRSVLYSWDIRPDDFSSSNERVVFDSRTLKAPYNNACGRVVDCPMVLPHMGGREQYVLYRFRPKALDVPYAGALAGDKEKDAAGVYYSKIAYSKPLPSMWRFGGDKSATAGSPSRGHGRTSRPWHNRALRRGSGQGLGAVLVPIRPTSPTGPTA